MIAHVLLPLPIDHGFDFLVPPALEERIEVGVRVKVRFNERERAGIVISLAEETAHPGTLEPVLDVVPAPVFPPTGLEFALQTARDCLAPPGLTLNRILPTQVSKDKMETFFSLAVDLNAAILETERLNPRAPRQAAILRALLAAGTPIAKRELRAQLGAIDRPLARLVKLGLVRETSPTPSAEEAIELPPEYKRLSGWVEELPVSGKILLFADRRAEGYLRLLIERLTGDGAGLILAPEIIAARELHDYLSQHLKERIGLYHSGLAEGTRGRMWEEVRWGKLRIVVGTRSAVFLPFEELSLVVVDQEEDRSYKQDEMLPYYHARELAEGRAPLVILASAAPAVETFHRTMQGELSLIRPQEEDRAIAARHIDMEKEKGILSEPLRRAIFRVLQAGKKALVTVPRRGYFQAVICKSCGSPLRCPDCGTNLVYEVERAQLICRVCGRAYPRFACPHCGSRALRFLGAGVERVWAELDQAFPEARVVRVDGRTVRKDPSLDIASTLSRADIVVGTPMIAKGQPLPALGLAAAVGIDAILATPDFRAAERAYQLLINLAGRLNEGELIVQTRFSDHYAIKSALIGDYEGFLQRELETREAFSYPPFAHLARLLLTSRGPAKRRSEAERIEDALKGFAIDILGPSPHPTRRGADLILIKAKDPQLLREACRTAKEAAPGVEIDINPDRI